MVKVDHIKHVIELSDGVSAAIDGNVVLSPKMASPSLENLQVHAWISR